MKRSRSSGVFTLHAQNGKASPWPAGWFSSRAAALPTAFNNNVSDSLNPDCIFGRTSLVGSDAGHTQPSKYVTFDSFDEEINGSITLVCSHSADYQAVE